MTYAVVFRMDYGLWITANPNNYHNVMVIKDGFPSYYAAREWKKKFIDRVLGI